MESHLTRQVLQDTDELVLVLMMTRHHVTGARADESLDQMKLARRRAREMEEEKSLLIRPPSLLSLVIWQLLKNTNDRSHCHLTKIACVQCQTLE